MSSDAKATIQKDGYEISNGFRIRLDGKSKNLPYQADLGRKSGKHVRERFRTLAEARNFTYIKRVEVERKGISSLKFSSEQKSDAVEALELLKEFNVNLRTAAAFYSKHHKKVDRTNGLGDLITQYLQEQAERVEKDDLRVRTYNDMRKRLKPFSKHLGRLAVDVVEAKDIDKVMDKCGYEGTNRQNYKNYLSGFYNWAVRGKKAPFNPVIETVKVKPESHTPEIYTASEVESIMGKAVELRPALVPYLAIAFFAGVRPEEIIRISRKDIDLDIGEIHIRAGQSKTHSARMVHISKNLKAWLLAYLSGDGLVFPNSESSLARWRAEVYCEAKVKSIQDGARHTFSTFHLARYESIDSTMLELGHTDSKMLFKHYRGLAKNRKAQSEKFFSILPEVAADKIIPLSSAKSA
jgi:integrase